MLRGRLGEVVALEKGNAFLPLWTRICVLGIRVAWSVVQEKSLGYLEIGRLTAGASRGRVGAQPPAAAFARRRPRGDPFGPVDSLIVDVGVLGSGNGSRLPAVFTVELDELPTTARADLEVLVASPATRRGHRAHEPDDTCRAALPKSISLAPSARNCSAHAPGSDAATPAVREERPPWPPAAATRSLAGAAAPERSARLPAAPARARIFPRTRCPRAAR